MTFGKSRKSLKTIAFILALTLSLLCISSCTVDKPTEPVEVILATTKAHEQVMSGMVKAFNKENEDVNVKLKVYATEDEKNYYLSHSADSSHVTTFYYAQDATFRKDYLLKLDRMSVINNFSVSVINYLRDSDGSIYVLPADGRYYTRTYNLDALESFVLTVPKTITELITLSARLKISAGSSSSYYASASRGGSDSVLFALMSVAYPLFLNTVKGTEFLDGVIEGRRSFTEEGYRESWTEVFEYLKLLYDNNFYSLSSVEKSFDEEIEYFESGSAAAMQNAGKVSLEKLFENVNGIVAPFVGKTERDACIGSAPGFYLSLTKNADENNDVLKASKRFLEYFASEKGQSFVRDSIDNDEYVTYLKNGKPAPEVYSPVKDKASEGRLFINDGFNYSFSYCVSDICDFLSSKITLDTLLASIDKKIKEGHNAGFYKIAEIEKTYEFDESRVYGEQTEIGDYFVTALMKSAYLDAALIPSSYIKCALLKGSLAENDLDAVFPEQNLVYVQLTADDFLKIYSDISENDSYPLTAGVTVRDGKLIKKSGRPYNDTDMLYALIPADKASLLSSSATLGKTSTSKSLLLSFFSASSTEAQDAKGEQLYV